MLTAGRVRLENFLEEHLLEDDTQRALHRSPAAAGRRGTSVVAIPMANDEEVIRSVAAVMDRELAQFILIGDEDDIRKTADRCRVSVDDAHFIPSDVNGSAVLAANLAATGEADILMKGHLQTADFIRAVLRPGSGLLDTGQLISHVAVLDIPAYHKLLVLTDAAINVEPNLEQKLTIIANAVRTARSIGVQRPKIACVAPVEKPSPKIPSTIDAEKITQLFTSGALRNRLGDVEIDGPFALDVALCTDAARNKEIESVVAGDADILLMPNLDAANALYKSLTHFGDAHAAAVVAGARVPIVLTSRSDSEQNKYCSVLLALAGVGTSERIRP